MAAYTTAQVRAIRETALKLARAAIGKPTLKGITVGGQYCDLLMDTETVGYCARLVRQCVEIGCGFGAGSWRYAGGSALETCQNLKTAGYKVAIEDREPGCIVGVNRNAGTYGHIVLYVGTVRGSEYGALDGVECVVENTSSGSRGLPRRAGTKLTPWSAIADRVTGVYRLAAYEEQAPVLETHSWRFTVAAEGADVVAKGVWATQFSDHETRTTIPADDPDVLGYSLPRGKSELTAGSPWAAHDISDYTQARIYCPATKRTIVAVLIDEGPSYKAEAGTGIAGSAAIDLSVGAAKALGLAAGQNARVDVRVLGRTAEVGRAAARRWAE